MMEWNNNDYRTQINVSNMPMDSRIHHVILQNGGTRISKEDPNLGYKYVNTTALKYTTTINE